MRGRFPLIKQLIDWLDDRSGFKNLIKRVRDEPIPGGAAGATSLDRPLRSRF